MRALTRRYLLLVLLPVALVILGARLLQTRKEETLPVASGARLGGLAAHLFRAEMGIRAAELVGIAPVLPSPDTTSPLYRAVAGGDTLAALGATPLGLSLTVAIGEAGGSMRAMTEPFSPLALRELNSRSGYGAALYLRGQRVLDEPEGFGPPAVPLDSLAWDGVEGWMAISLPDGRQGALLPLDPSAGRRSAVHLLAAPGATGDTGGPMPGWPALVALAVLAALPLLAWGAPHSRVRRMGLGWLPLLVLWGFLLVTGGEVRERFQEEGTRDLVRTLSVLKGMEGAFDLQGVADATGYELTRIRQRRVEESTIEDPDFRASLEVVPPPLPTFPRTGSLLGPDGSHQYASLFEPPATTLVLTAPSTDGALRSFWLFLAILGGLASLGPMAFLLASPREPDHVS